MAVTLLPDSYLFTSGNQIVDDQGRPVRIEAVGVQDPLTATDMQRIAQQFNTIRVSWVDENFAADFQRMKDIAALAKQYGVKVIFDHHTNENGTGEQDMWGAQQQNGLWYSVNSGAHNATDNTDGGGNQGTTTHEEFLDHWLQIAAEFAKPEYGTTVIGFDLHNEPLVQGVGTGSTWGDGNIATDLQMMYEEVGKAIQMVNSNALIIAEGPQNYNGNFDNPNGPSASGGDLSRVDTHPVILTVANKVYYSVHHYPKYVGGDPVYSGLAKVEAMNAAWGYLMDGDLTNGEAPVFIGEMGANFDGSYGGEVVSESDAWADTLIDYMNGLYATQGGPEFTGNQQGVAGTWWVHGYKPGDQLNGTLNADGTYKSVQLSYHSQLDMTPLATMQEKSWDKISGAWTSSTHALTALPGTAQTLAHNTTTATVNLSGATPLSAASATRDTFRFSYGDGTVRLDGFSATDDVLLIDAALQGDLRVRDDSAGTGSVILLNGTGHAGDIVYIPNVVSSINVRWVNNERFWDNTPSWAATVRDESVTLAGTPGILKHGTTTASQSFASAPTVAGTADRDIFRLNYGDGLLKITGFDITKDVLMVDSQLKAFLRRMDDADGTGSVWAFNGAGHQTDYVYMPGVTGDVKVQWVTGEQKFHDKIGGTWGSTTQDIGNSLPGAGMVLKQGTQTATASFATDPVIAATEGLRDIIRYNYGDARVTITDFDPVQDMLHIDASLQPFIRCMRDASGTGTVVGVNGAGHQEDLFYLPNVTESFNIRLI